MYVVGTQKNRLNEMILLTTQNKCLNWWVRIYSQFCTLNFCLFILTYEPHYLTLYFTNFELWNVVGLWTCKILKPWALIKYFRQNDYHSVYGTAHKILVLIEYVQKQPIVAHAEVYREAVRLKLVWDFHLHLYFVNASSKDSGESAHLCRLTWEWASCWPMP